MILAQGFTAAKRLPTEWDHSLACVLVCGGRATSPAVPSSVVGRAFAILRAFNQNERELTAAQLAVRTGLPTSTAHRIATELVHVGALERVNGRFRPDILLFELGQFAEPRSVLREAAMPFMEDLYEATHHTVHLGVLDGSEVVYVERLTGTHGSKVPSRVGGRNPAHCTGLGKALLAHQPRRERDVLLEQPLVAATRHSITDPVRLQEELTLIVDRGAAYDQEEARLGLACVAAPVLDARRRAVAALSLSGPVAEIDRGVLTPAIRTAAMSLARVLRRS
jgi:DNA-binding IclR family transcriptional regulator